MGKPTVSVYLRISSPQRYRKPVWESRTMLRPYWCIVNDQPEHHPEGTYQLRYRKAGKQVWETVQGDGLDALTLSKQRAIELSRKPLGRPKSEPERTEVASFKVSDEVKVYLANVEKLAPKTLAAYRLTLSLFQESCAKIFVHQITKQDLQAFDSFLLKRGDEDRTRANRIQHVVTFLRNKEGRRAGPPVENVAITVKFVEQPPEAYTRSELEELFHASSEADKLLWRFFLGTGFRESEVSVAEYTDINLEKRTIQVIEKTQYGFKPKDCEKRVVPIPDELLTCLAVHKNGSPLIFPKNGQPDGHLLRRLKRIKPDAILHRFRKHFATDRHEAGASARQIQKWLGHSSLETTLRYLATMDDQCEKVRNICNVAHGGL
jgi:integrase